MSLRDNNFVHRKLMLRVLKVKRARLSCRLKGNFWIIRPKKFFRILYYSAIKVFWFFVTLWNCSSSWTKKFIFFIFFFFGFGNKEI